MASGVVVVAGDTQPELTITLYSDAAGTQPLDLTTAASVAWHVETTPPIIKTATVSNATGGVTTWRMDGDPALIPGVYNVRPVITWGDGTVETAQGTATITVLPAA